MSDYYTPRQYQLAVKESDYTATPLQGGMVHVSKSTTKSPLQGGGQEVPSQNTKINRSGGVITLTLLFLLLSLSLSAQLTLTDSLVAYYPFNGNANDSTNNNNDGTVNGATLTTDRFGNDSSAYSFDGVDDYIDLDTLDFDLSVGFSFSGWARSDQVKDWARIFDLGNGQADDNIVLSRYASTDSLRYDVYVDNIGQGVTGLWIDLDLWSHYAIRHSPDSSAEIYINGSLVGQGKIPPPQSLSRSSVFIGRSNWTGDHYYSGDLDDMYFFNRVITNTEIANLYQNFSPPDTLIVEAGNDTITLNWGTNRIAALDQYYIYRNNTLYDSVVVTGLSDTSYLDLDVTAGRLYSYSVTSVDTLGYESQHTDTIAVSGDGLVAFFPFNGDATDSTDNNYNGSSTGGPDFTAFDRFGNANRAVDFDGTDDRIIFDDVSSDQDYTVSLWFRTDQVSTASNSPDLDMIYRLMVANGSNLSSSGVLFTEGNLRFNQDNGLVQAQSFDHPFSDTASWHHIAAVGSSGPAKFYLDGNLLHTTEGDGFPGFTSFHVGYSNHSGEKDFYDGAIDDIRIYNRAISDEEIADLVQEEAGSLYTWSDSTYLSFSEPTPDDDFQVPVRFGAGDFDYSKAKADGSDLRFEDLNGNSLHYYLEKWNDSDSSIVWVKVADAGTSTILMRYGNPYAASESNGDSTFIFFDDFEDGVYTDKWLLSKVSGYLGATFEETNGAMNITNCCQGSTYCSEGQGLFFSLDSFLIDNQAFTLDVTSSIATNTAGRSAVFVNLSEVGMKGDPRGTYDRRYGVYVNSYLTDVTSVNFPPEYNQVQNNVVDYTLGALYRHTVTYDGSSGAELRIYDSAEQLVGSRNDVVAYSDSAWLNVYVEVHSPGSTIDQIKIYKSHTTEITAVTTPDEGLIAYYPFNGDANDSTGNDNNGTVNGATLTTDRFGNPDAAYSFDGVNDYIELVEAETMLGVDPTAWSFSIWIKHDGSIASSATVISDYNNIDTDTHDNRFGIQLAWNNSNSKYGSDVREAHAGIDGYAASFQVNAEEEVNQWAMYTVVVSKTEESLTIYKNGSLEDTTSINGEIDYIEDELIRVGASYFSNALTNFYLGVVDDIRIYSRALDSAEVAELYDLEKPTLSDGLVAYYTFDGDATDQSGNGNNGNTIGDPDFNINDRLGSANAAIYMDANDLAEFPVDTDDWINTQFSISGWFKVDSLNTVNDQYLISQLQGTNNGWAVYIDQTNDLLRFYGDDLVNDPTIDISELSSGEWFQLSIVSNQSDRYLYINGTLADSATNTWNISDQNGITLGDRLPAADGMTGSYDDIRIYSRALDSAEVAELYDLEKPTLSDGLVAYYTFDGNATDRSGNGNDGTVNGAIETNDRYGNANAAYAFLETESIDLPVDIDPYLDGMSIVTWVYFDTLDNSKDSYIISQWDAPNGFGLYTDAGGGGNLRFFGDQPTSGDPSYSMDSLSSGRWYQIIGVSAGTTKNLYLDGQLVATHDNAWNDSGLSGLTIGDAFASPVSIKGKVDDVRIYSRALDSAEVAELYELEVPPLRVGLVAYYTFDGDATDQSGNGNNGTENGGVSYTTDRLGNANAAASFDGVDDWIDLGNSVGNGIRTISLWFSPEVEINSTLVGAESLIQRNTTSSDGEFGLSFQQSSWTDPGTLGFANTVGSTGDGIVSDRNNWSSNTWVHAVGVIDPIDGLKLYINGELQSDTASITGETDTRSEITAIGQWGDSNNPDRFYNGQIDDIRIYSRVLDSTEVAELHNLEKPTLSDGLVAYYTFDGDATDQSGNGNNGTANGGVSYTTDRLGNANAAASFDGVDDYILFPSDDLGTFDHTVNMWIETDHDFGSYPDYGMLFHWGDADCEPVITLSIRENEEFLYGAAECAGGSVQVYSPTNYSGLHMLTASYHATDAVLKLYVDGVYVGQGTDNLADMSNPGAGFSIGRHGYKNEGLYTGSIDDIRIYSRILDSTQIIELYDLEKPTLSDGLVAYYTFDGDATDQSGNGNDGTINGATETTDRFGNDSSAYSFDGVDDWIEIGGASGVKTLSLWFYNNEAITISSGNRYLFSDTDSRPYFVVGPSTAQYENEMFSYAAIGGGEYYWTNVEIGSTQISSSWHNVVLIWDQVNTNYRLYLDGDDKGLAQINPTVNESPDLDSGIWFGKQNLSNNYNWDGSLDDIRIYTRSLDSAEILELYDLEKPTLSDGLVAYYPFDGDATDQSGNGNDGAVNGATPTADRYGSLNAAYSFDGDMDEVDVGNLELVNNPFTLSMWIYPDDNDASNAFYSENEGGFDKGTLMVIGSDSKYAFGIKDGTNQYTATGSLYEPNKWSHLAGIRDDNSIKLYLNGKLLSSIPITAWNDISVVNNVKIGLQSDYPNDFNGKIDDVRIYSRALDSLEVAELYDLEKPTLDDGLVAYYTFDGDATDQSGNGNDGTESGGVTYTTDRLGNANTAASFDGVDDEISVSAIDLANSSFSLSVWEKVNPIHPDGALFFGQGGSATTGGHISAGYRPGEDKAFVGIYNDGSLEYTLGSSGTWRSWVFTYDDNTYEWVMYLNGHELTRRNGTVSFTGSGPFYMGRGGLNLITAFEGDLDDLRLYSRILDSTEVAELYELEAPTLSDGLLAYYTFNGDATDQSGNGNDGTVNGATPTADRFGNDSSAYSFDRMDDNIDLPVISGVESFQFWVTPGEDISTTVPGPISGEGLPLGVISDLVWLGGFSGDIINSMVTLAPSGNNYYYWEKSLIPAIKKGVDYHLFFNWDDNTSNYRLFLNGEDLGSALTFGAPTKLDTVDWYIGTTDGDTFLGIIDDIRLYSRSLDSSEILELYDLEKPTLSDGLVAYYTFDGDATDQSGNGNDGTVNGATETSDRFGNANSAYFFDDSDTGIDIPANFEIALSNNFTSNIWVYPTESPSGYAFYVYTGAQANNQSWMLGIGNNGEAMFEKYGHVGAWILGPDLPLNTWTMMTGVVGSDGDKGSLYVNGEFVGSNDSGEAFNLPNPSPMTIGSLNVGLDKPKGKIDDIRVYSRALDSTEIAELYYLEKPTLSDGLVAYYTFDGDATDQSGNGNDGSVNGATLTIDRLGNAGAAYDFNGSSDWIELPVSALNDLPSGTVLMWAKVDDFSSSMLIDKTTSLVSDYLMIQPTPDQKLKFRLDQDYNSTDFLYVSDQTVSNEWFHVGMTWNGTEVSIYIDGAKENTLSSNEVLTDANVPVYLGRGPSGAPYLDGKLDDVRIYSRALDSAEVAELYDLEKPTLDDGLVAYYTFDGDATDQSGNGNDGTVNGATLTTDRFGNADAAFSFDGVDDEIDCGLIVDGTTYTYSAWFRTDGIPVGKNVVISNFTDLSDPDRRALMFDSNLDLLVFDNDIGNWLTMGTVEANQWHFALITQSNNVLKAYLNGELVVNQSNSVIPSTGTFNIGAFSTSSPNYFDGEIDDVRIYSRALDSTEVSELYNLEKPTLTDGLVGYYTFDGDAIDQSGNGNNGTENGGVSYTTDRFGKASATASFDGVDDWIDLGNLSQDADVKTWVVWAKSSIQGDQYASPSAIMSNINNVSNGGIELRVTTTATGTQTNEGGIYAFTGNGANSIAGSELLDTEWHQYVISYNGSDLSLYEDGLLKGSIALSLESTAINLEIGRDSWTDSRFWNGAIDDIRIYSRALDSAEVTELYELEKPTLDDGLVAYYKFDGDATDQSGNGNDGTESGGVTYTTDRLGNANTAASFDGVDDKVSVADNDLWSSDIKTVSLWFKPDDFDHQAFIGQWNDNGEDKRSWLLGFSNTDLRVYESSDGTNAGYNFHVIDYTNFSNWTHLVYIKSGSSVKSYINGSLTTESLDMPSPLFNYDGPMTIGHADGSGGGTDAWFNGTLDDIRIYSRSLDSIEVAELYDLEKPTLSDGLVAYYTFDGDATDQSGNGNDGIINGATETIDRFGSSNAAYSFDGMNDRIDFNYSPVSGQNERTFTTWFRTSNSAGQLWSYGNPLNGEYFEFGGNGPLQLGIFGGWVGFDTDFNDGKWHQVILTSKDDQIQNVKVYFDGKELPITSSDLTVTSINTGTNNNFTVGVIERLPDRWFNGSIDDIRIYSRVLDSAEVAELYSLEAPTLSDGLVAYYTFDGDAADQSGNGNDGTVNGALPTTDRFGNDSSAYIFDGVDDYVAVGDLAFGKLQFSAVGWFNQVSDGTWGTLFSDWINVSAGRTFLLEVNTGIDEFLVQGVNSSNTLLTYQGGVTLNQGWNQAAYIYDQGEVIIFINGQEIYRDNSTLSGILGYNAANGVELGVYNTTLAPFSGSLDDFRFYERALDATDIANLYQNFSPPDTLIAQAGNDIITLNWGANRIAALDQYYIYRNNVLYDSVEVIGSSDTSYVDLDVTAGSLYSYSVTSLDTLGYESQHTDTVTVSGDGLVAFYPFNGNANDSTENNNDGTENGGVALATDRFGNDSSAYSFDGVDDWIGLTSSALNDISNGTVSVWINLNTLSSRQAILWKGNPESSSSDYQLLVDDGTNGFAGEIWSAIRDATGIQHQGFGNQPIDSSRWLQLMHIWDGTNQTIYINGEQVGSFVSNQSLWSNTDQIAIVGAQASDGNNVPDVFWFNGLVDDLRIYTRALDSAEVAQLYTSERPPAPFITTWETTQANDTITIPTFSGETYDYWVDWGDGTVETGFTGDASHAYDTAGTYTISISGDFPRIYFYNSGDKDHENLLSIDQWGDISWTNMEWAFAHCPNLTYNATDAPDLSLVTDMSHMFNSSAIFNGDLSAWDVSTVTDMSLMFQSASAFNGDISTWDVSSVINMYAMFNMASAFNGDLSAWNVLSVENMSAMFHTAGSFSGDISSWDVSSVTDMSSMFRFANSFNSDLRSWDVSSVSNMDQLFYRAGSFDQNLGDWDISSVTTMELMFDGNSISKQNYDSTLIGWSTLDVGESQIPMNVNFSTNDLIYCLAENRRDTLIITYNWTISGDTKECTLSDGLLAYYPFNGNADDSTGNGNDGTLGDGVTSSTFPTLTPDRFGRIDSAYSFDGADDWVDAGFGNNTEYTDLTINSWFNTNDFQNGGDEFGNVVSRMIVSNDGLIRIGGYGSSASPEVPGIFRLDLEGNNVTSTDIYDDGLWHMVTVVLSGSDNLAYLYLDNDLIGSCAYDGTLNSIDASFQIGSRLSGTEEFYTGFTDDIRIYNREITPSEILNLYNQSGWPILNDSTDILTFTIDGHPEALEGQTIDTANHSVDITLDYGTDLTSLIPSFTLSTGAILKLGDSIQESGVTALDFTDPVGYYVVAENNVDSAEWTVSVTNELNDSTDILTFTIDGHPEALEGQTIDTANHTVDITLDYGTDLTSLIPTFTLSSGAILKLGDSIQESGVSAVDFTNPVNYYVVAENAIDSAEWIVTITNVLNDSTDIVSFSFPEQKGAAFFDYDNDSIAIEVVNGTDLATLVASFEVSAGATMTYAGDVITSPVTNIDYNDPAIFWVYAENGLDSAEWIVVVIEALSDSTDILTFTIDGHPEALEGQTIDTATHTVDITLDYGTDLTSLIPSFTLSSGAFLKLEDSIQESGVSSVDFTNPVSYYVVAENGVDSAEWVVDIMNELNDSTDIISFDFDGEPIILADTLNTEADLIHLLLPYDTKLSELTPRFIVSSGASLKLNGVLQESGVSLADFSAGTIYYTVVAENGMDSSQWTLTLELEIAPAGIRLEAPTGNLLSESFYSIDSAKRFSNNDVLSTPDPVSSSIDIGYAYHPDLKHSLYSISSYPILIYDLSSWNTRNTMYFSETGLSELEYFSVDEVDFLEIYENGSWNGEQIDSLEKGQVIAFVTRIENGQPSRDSQIGLILIDSIKGIWNPGDFMDVQVRSRQLYSDTEITAFSFPEQTGDAFINADNDSVAIVIEYGTDLSTLVASFEVSTGATMTYAGDVITSPVTNIDYNDPAIFWVYAENGLDSAEWIVVVTDELNDSTDILSFDIPGLDPGSLEIDTEAHLIIGEVAYGTDLTNLTPTITVSQGASIDPASGTVQDFTDTVTYTVTAEDDFTTQEWKVVITEDAGLVAWYPFNGDATDASGNGNNGSLVEATLTTDRFGNVEAAFSFDGVDDFIHVETLTDLGSSEFSIIAWFKSTDNNGRIIHKRHPDEEGFFLSTSNDQYQFYVFDGFDRLATGSGSGNDGQWHLIAGVREPERILLYIDGIEVARITIDNVDISNDAALGIGGRQAAGFNEFFSGSLDDISVYNRAISQTDIDSLYSLGGWPEGSNDAPTDISLVGSTLAENSLSNTLIGQFSTTDPNETDVHVYSLVSGAGDTHNGEFTLSSSGELRSNFEFNFETTDPNPRSIRVQTDDQFGGTWEEEFLVTIIDVNDDPSSISMTNTGVFEEQEPGYFVGEFNTEDEDASDSHTYSLVSGSGDTHNDQFDIVNDSLVTAVQLDFETGINPLSIRVETSDGNGGTTQHIFSITILDVVEGDENTPPSGITLSETSVYEDMNIGDLVGRFTTIDPDPDDHMYSLVPGVLDDDNGSFSIQGDSLLTSRLFNYEDEDALIQIRVETHDGTDSLEWVFQLELVDVNERPTGLTLSHTSVKENEPVNTRIGKFTSSDDDSGDTHTYEVIAGSELFGIDGDSLITLKTFDYEEDIRSHNITIRTTDAGFLTFDESFVITVEDVYEPSDSTEILEYSFAEQTGPADIDTASNTVDIEVLNGTDVSNLVATFNLSFGATLKADGVQQESGVTSNDFTSPFSYYVVAENLVDSALWVVTVTIANVPAEDFILSNTTISAGDAGIVVGEFIVVDEDSLQDYSFEWRNDGNNDNNRFSINSNNELVTDESLSSGTYDISVSAISNEESLDGNFVITVIGIEEIIEAFEEVVNATGRSIENYRIIGVPVKQVGLGNFFKGMDVGQLGKTWRILNYSETNGARDLQKSGLLVAGKGYWFISDTNVEIELPANAKPAELNNRGEFGLELEAGWNLIGNPYSQSIDWTSIINENVQLSDGEVGIIYKYTGSDSSGGYTTSDQVLDIFEGGYVQATNATTVYIKSPTMDASGRIGDGSLVTDWYRNQDWRLSLDLTTKKQFYEVAGIGVRRNASMQRDFDDLMAPPSIETMLIMSEASTGLSLNRVPVNDYLWEFVVTGPKEQVTISWTKDIASRVEQTLVLVSEEYQLVDMKHNSSFTFNLDGEYHLSIQMGQPVGSIPLVSARPNPAHDQITFSFFIPGEEGVQKQVGLTIFSMEGKEIHTGSFTAPAGSYHEVEWDMTVDGSALPEGLYLYKVTIDGKESRMTKFVKN